MSWRTFLKDSSDRIAIAIGRLIAPREARALHSARAVQARAVRVLEATSADSKVVPVDPFVVAKRLHLTPLESLAAFESLVASGQMRPVFVVRMDDGEILNTYSSRTAIPGDMLNRYDEVVSIGPENITLGFQAAV
jgi:hypothetical protein